MMTRFEEVRVRACVRVFVDVVFGDSILMSFTLNRCVHLYKIPLLSIALSLSCTHISLQLEFNFRVYT